MKEIAFTPASLDEGGDGWRLGEIRAERGTLSVRISGALVSSAESLNEFTGHIALQVRRGSGIEFRDVRVERLPSAVEPFGQGAARGNEAGVMPPRAIRTAMPFYPKEPHDKWIQGVTSLELVVEPTGEAGDIRVVKSLHPDLDEAAVASARQWRFSPGTKAGQAIPVIVSMEVSFRRTQ
jgi:TonB family protein